MDAHLEAIPSVGTITTRGTARCDDELLGWDADGSLNLVMEFLGLGNNLGASLLERFGVLASESHSDSLDLLSDLFSLDLVFFLNTVHHFK